MIIQLTKGQVAIIDECDAWVAVLKWHALARSDGKGYYAARKSTGKSAELLHRVIMNAPAEMLVDHCDGDGLNCQRSNLRLATYSQNNMNSRRFGSSGYKGVSRAGSRWRALIGSRTNRKHLGYFDNPIEAAMAYDAAAKIIFGQFARLNFVEGFMRAVLEKIKFKGFIGSFDVHGTEREISYTPASNGDPSMLIVEGLELDDALHVLEHLHGGLLQGKDAEQPPKKEPKAEKPAEHTNGTNGKAQAKAPPAPKPEPKPEPESAGDDDLDGDVISDTIALDITAMQGMGKLREVIEHMLKSGYKKVDDIVNVSATLVEKVPALKALKDKGGDFDKRMERAALVVLGGPEASA